LAETELLDLVKLLMATLLVLATGLKVYPGWPVEFILCEVIKTSPLTGPMVME